MVKFKNKKEKKDIRIAAVVAGLIVLVVLLGGPALAFGVLSTFGEVEHELGTRTITVDLNISKNTNEVISTNGITAKLGRIAVDANADTIDLTAGLGSNVNFNVSSTSTVCNSANNSLSYGYAYGTENYYPYYSMGAPGYGYSYGYGYRYENTTGSEIQCTFTFNDVPEGVYVAIKPYINGTTDQYMLEVKTLNKIIGVLDASGTDTKELNFIMPSENGSVGTNTLMTKLTLSGVRDINNDTNYISVVINNDLNLSYGSATAAGDVFEFGPTGSTFTDANITIYYAKIADLNTMSNSDLTNRLNIYQYHGTTWTDLGGTVDTTNKQISVSLEEFSAYTTGLVATSSSSHSSSGTTSSGTITTISTTTETLSYTPAELETALEAMTDDTGAQLFSSAEIAAMVANSTNFEFERTVLVEKIVASNGTTSYKVTVTTTVKNTTTGDLKDVKVVIEVPKAVANSASNIQSLIPFTTLVNDPVLEFNLSSLKAGQEASIAYTVTSTTAPNLTNAKFSEPAILAATKVTAPAVTPGTTPGTTPGKETPTTTPGTETPGAQTPSAPMDYTLLIVLVVILVVAGAAYFLVIKKKGKNNLKF